MKVVNPNPIGTVAQPNKSRLTIKADSYQQMEQEIKKMQYPTYAIFSAEKLQQKIQSFKSDFIKKCLKDQLINLNSYRKIRGDGNCFFRAFAFSYLTIISDPSIEKCFPHLDELNLACCYQNSIPADFKKFYDHSFLLKMLKSQWVSIYSKLLKQAGQNTRKALIQLFYKFPFLDFIVILYFRAACLKYLENNYQKYKQFLLDNQQNNIKTYSEESEGVPIYLCSLMTQIAINVYQIRTNQVKPYHYNQMQKKIGQVHLLYHQKHYDIIEKNDRIQQQKDIIKLADNFYGKICKKTKLSQCVECGRKCQVYQQSSVCLKCYDKLTSAQKQYEGKKGQQKLIKATCNDCKTVRPDISQAFGLCRRCIENQNKIQEQRKKQSENPKTKIIRGRCYECKYFDDLNSQTYICSFCSKKQKIALNKLQQTQSKQQIDKSVLSKEDINQRKTQKNQYKRKENNWENMVYSNKKDLQSKIQQKLLNTDMNRFKLQQTIKDAKIRTIGTEIKDMRGQRRIMMQSSKKDEAKYSWQKKQEEVKSRQPNMQWGKCCNCGLSAMMHEKSPICETCVRQTFKTQGNCAKCKFIQKLNDESYICKECHICELLKKVANNDTKNPSALYKRMCVLCKKAPQFKQSVCQKCFYKQHCQRCQKKRSLILGNCYQCRYPSRRY